MTYQPGNPMLDAIRARGHHLDSYGNELLKAHRKGISERFEKVKAHYAAHTPAMLLERNEWAIDPYAWEEQGVVLTPIETALWEHIRASDAVLYPQYPVGWFFVDFGNPAARVAIECDGFMYHQDKEKDRARQDAIEALGWTVYRFTGRECRSSAAGVAIRRIAAEHRIARGV